jgi:hypothetical protein
MAPLVSVLLEPLAALFYRERLQVESDRRVDDVVVVQLGQRWEVGQRGRAYEN